MKVCLLLSGHMRNSEEVFPYFKSNLLDRYDVDTFISVWDSSMIYVHTPKIYETIKLFKPVAFEIENYEALAIFHADCASQLMLTTKPEKGVFYNTTPFAFVEAQIHAQLSTTFATIAISRGVENNEKK